MREEGGPGPSWVAVTDPGESLQASAVSTPLHSITFKLLSPEYLLFCHIIVITVSVIHVDAQNQLRKILIFLEY